MGIMNSILRKYAKSGKKVIQEMEEISKNPMDAQKKFLRKLLQKNANTVYGQEHDFQNIDIIEMFREKHPVTTYDDYVPYLSRMVDGEKDILVSDKIGHYSKTSGTVGVPKKIPLTKGMIGYNFRFNLQYTYALIAKDYGMDFLKGKTMALIEGQYEVLPSGATYGAASAVSAKYTGFGPFKDLTGKVFSSPLEARVPEEGTNTRYLHSRFALMEKDLTFAMTTFSSFMLEILRYIENNWEILVHDIETGTIDKSINIPEESKKTLLPKCKPMPKRAEELRAIFSQGFEEPFIPKVWPGLCVMTFVGGASFETYTNTIKERYAGPNVHYLFTGLCSSESLMSVPYKTETFDSILIPDSVFYEFRPLEEEDLSKCLTLDQLEVGGKYEIIITSVCGFCRYRMKDAIEVTGFYHKNPTIRFLYRVDQTVNITGEKTTETALRYAVSNASKELEIDMIDYCMYPDVDSVPMRYVFLVEVEELPVGVTKEQFRACIDKHLAVANPSMGKKIETGVCAPSGLILLQKETFLLYRDMMIMLGSSAAQLKPVHIIMNEKQRKFFFGLEDKEI